MPLNQMCPVCKGRRTDGNGRVCRRCEGNGELKPRIARDELAYMAYQRRSPGANGKAMRKRLISPIREVESAADPKWLEIHRSACVEVTSEQLQHPIEGALVTEDSRGWRASEKGPQTVRLVFDHPQNIARIALAFEEKERERTQEFVLRWITKMGKSHEIVRQQWNFSPPSTIREVENYAVQLAGVSALELIINPDISGGEAMASLLQLRLA